MKEIRKYRRNSQEDFASWLGVTKQAYGKKERGEADGFSAGDFEAILEKTDIDARWLFGQMKGAIEGADLRISGGSDDAADVHEIVTEYRTWKESLSKDDGLLQRLHGDPELKECVELLIQNRGEVGRIIGYMQRGMEDRAKFGKSEKEKEWDGAERRKASNELGQ